ncbi:D123-domain-containing protein [Choiromyces venosus 120613-1]|uniref:D123-domain-containing protein n=1 Tax=Choiromyces venosus 120613-1 TaxID=1336337 RepID=A0A3N4J8Q0_9PEZI|nr:D123-domain-containing protein [Choiromyces venosus 120613-1]
MVHQDPDTHPLTPPQTLHEIFPPVHKSHILNCAFASWHTRYKSITPEARTIPLTPEFLTYLREDGIILPDDDDEDAPLPSSSQDSDEEMLAPTNFPPGAEDEEDEEDKARNPTRRFPALHAQVKQAIASLGGSVTPKLNWSSPTDALFMSATHSLECRSPAEIYLLLKSSDFITHDLEHAFDDTCPSSPLDPSSIPYHLVLRKYFSINPALEFRTFVAGRRILGITQRDLNHYPFLQELRSEIRSLIVDFFEDHLQSFPDEDFVFDCYVEPTVRNGRRRKVWLVDINPFAPRTDSRLFSWGEVLRLRTQDFREEEEVVEVRLVEIDDPEAWGFNSATYSASKLPREVVEAGVQGEEAVWEFARRWRGIMEEIERGEGGDED